MALPNNTQIYLMNHMMLFSKVIRKEGGEEDTLETFFKQILKIHLYRFTLNYFHITASQ